MKTDLLDIRLGDCMDLMRETPDKAFDLAICDPQYGIGMGGGQRYTRGGKRLARQTKYKTFDDSEPPDADYFLHLRRISKNQIIFGANHFIERMPINASCWIVWDKMNGDYTAADCELAWTSFDTAVRKFEFRWHGMLQGDMENKESRINPCQKPVALYRWLLANYAKPGQTILDTHMGSGSIAIACHYAGNPLVACELDPDYYAAACARIERETRHAEFAFAATVAHQERELPL